MNDQNILKRHLQPAARKLGLPFVNWRCLRTSHATWLVQAGADPKSVQGQMRHSRISTTMDSALRSCRRHSGERCNSSRRLPAAGVFQQSSEPRPWISIFRRPTKQKTPSTIHGPIHGPKRSNKAAFPMFENGCKSRQAIEKIGGASRDRTDDLIVAKDALSHA
jgi:hypothetical protein